MEEKFKFPKKAVIDASFILSLFLPDEKTKKVGDKFLILYNEGEISLFAPYLLSFEVVNGLKMAIKRKRITQNKGQALAKAFLKLKIDYQEVGLIRALKLALKHNLSVYDTCYLTLSRQLKHKLLTLDKKLAAF